MIDKAEMISAGMEPIEGYPGLYKRCQPLVCTSRKTAMAVARAIAEFEMTGEVQTTFKSVINEKESEGGNETNHHH